MALLSLLRRKFLAIACLLALALGLMSVASAGAEVYLILFRTVLTSAGQINVEWATATERDTTGFRLSRSLEATSGFMVIAIVPAQGDAVTGASYSYLDTSVVRNTRYYYLLEAVHSDGTAAPYGPISAVVSFVYLPLLRASSP
jgi:hypothetical protein